MLYLWGFHTHRHVDFENPGYNKFRKLARLRHVAGTQWGTRCYMNMDHLTRPEDEPLSDIIAG